MKHNKQPMKQRLNSAMPMLTRRTELPFLPGHVFTDPYQQSYKKQQIFTLDTKTCTEKDLTLHDNKDKLEIQGKPEMNSTTSGFSSSRLSTREPKTLYNESYPRILPQWIKYDNKVLKFYGYFNEPVVESVHENHRARNVTVYYYLNDDTIHIGENKSENSGIPQGYFVKRHKIEKKTVNTVEESGGTKNMNKTFCNYNMNFGQTNFNQTGTGFFTGGNKNNKDTKTNNLNSQYNQLRNNPLATKNIEYLHWRDFNLQSEISLYGKKFRISDCDDFTKQFYIDNNVDQTEPEVFYEVENLDETYKRSKINKVSNNANIAELKEYIEVKLKGGHPNRNLKQILKQ